MIKKLKKGFTLVELIVVIAIIAILSTVAIIGFTRVVDKANVSNDTQLVRNLNERMALHEAEGKAKPQTAHDALVLTEDFGYIIEKLTPSSSGNDIVWDSSTNRFALISSEDQKVVYSDPQVTLSTNPINLWKMYKTLPSESEYSIYLAGTTITGDISVGVGVDVGRNGNVNINYENTSGPKQEVVIRTNGGDLTVDATNDDVKHYGLVNGLTVAAVRVYHEFGFVCNLQSFETGKFVAENGAQFHQTRDEIDLILNGKSFDLDNGEEYTQHYYVGGQCIVCNKDEQEQNVEQIINAGDTLTMSMGESVNIKFNSNSAVFWSLNDPISPGADNQYHETISNESISISNIKVEQNTATVTAKKGGTNDVYVIYNNEVPGDYSLFRFSIVVSGTAKTATIVSSKYNNETLGSPAEVDHLVFGEYSKYADVWEGETYCIMDQAGEGTIRAYSVTYSVENSSDETVIYILSQSAMIYPQGEISSITAKFKNIKTIDLGNLDFSAATKASDFSYMFTGLTELTTIFATAEQVAQMHTIDISKTLMFQECTSLVGGKGTEWSEGGYYDGSHEGTKGYYAYIDGQGLELTDKKGYFTDRTQSPYYVPE